MALLHILCRFQAWERRFIHFVPVSGMGQARFFEI